MGDENTVTLSDLKKMGKHGGSTARLEDGIEIKLLKDYAIKFIKGYVKNELMDVELRLPYKEIYKQIRTIKNGQSLIARRERTLDGYQLRLTGDGFSR